ncbi:MAG: exodeoxyribonuclease V subunit alpha [Desulfobulbaceae bacterium]|nr:exodeoxyribonuclease V subunit alpha [Desulfobulbaceae bacterium]
MLSTLQEAVALGELRSVDLHLASFLARIGGSEVEPACLSTAALACKAVGEGHVCLPLSAIAEKTVFNTAQSHSLPPVQELKESLLRWPVVGHPGQNTPLILDEHNRLYLARYYVYEQQLAAKLIAMAIPLEEPDLDKARQALDQLFPPVQEIDYQKIAAAMVLLQRIVVISGGPGTGKTHTVSNILALLAIMSHKPLRIGLAAPTGKAAARLGESLRLAWDKLPADCPAVLPETPRTLHRLLGVSPGSLKFRHNRDNPLLLDLLILDEASMIDVPLMAALFDALLPQTRLIILGDRNQLASVEAGSLFADLCGPELPAWSAPLTKKLSTLTGHTVINGQGGGLRDSVVMLQQSFRFQEKSGIGRLVEAVKNNQPQGVEQVLNSDFDDLELLEETGNRFDGNHTKMILEGFTSCLQAESAQKGLENYSRFRILCALREGPRGVGGVTRQVESLLRRHKLIPPPDRFYYKGRPIMILRNHYGLQLFNGDTGIIWPDEHNRLQAWFMREDGKPVPISPARLPQHETAYAITVHKSQGSEFDHVLFMLPQEDNRLLSRELLYTGISRAKLKLSLCADREILRTGLARRIHRHSGLAEKLSSTS